MCALFLHLAKQSLPVQRCRQPLEHIQEQACTLQEGMLSSPLHTDSLLLAIMRLYKHQTIGLYMPVSTHLCNMDRATADSEGSPCACTC